jgi:hypothetical protein
LRCPGLKCPSPQHLPSTTIQPVGHISRFQADNFISLPSRLDQTDHIWAFRNILGLSGVGLLFTASSVHNCRPRAASSPQNTTSPSCSLIAQVSEEVHTRNSHFGRGEGGPCIWYAMEDPQANLSMHHIDSAPPMLKTKGMSSVSTSPEHSRARSKKTRCADQPSYTDSRPQIRRRESYADGTRRGRSCTRSVSPESAKRRSMRRRRSRSPSRSCSTSAAESQSPTVKRQRRSHNEQANDEHFKSDIPAGVARDESRESMRSRSKRRKKYRRRSDYAAAAADAAEDTDLRSLRGARPNADENQNGDMPCDGNADDRIECFESVLEEDEEGDGSALKP